MLPERPAGRLKERRWTAILQGATLQGEEGQPQRSDSFKATSSKRHLRGDAPRSDAPTGLPGRAFIGEYLKRQFPDEATVSRQSLTFSFRHRKLFAPESFCSESFLQREFFALESVLRDKLFYDQASLDTAILNGSLPGQNAADTKRAAAKRAGAKRSKANLKRGGSPAA
ncbi:hypothetical protein GGP77_003532 [Salinibacter ruber]|uniref:hypothetical protein n=1 Tax=Salinibacter ruber TaxID=146919 RepID=UPI0021687877|nr:hypothetical protein [Salinibacter ruber]MCS3669276.1 hypothetical protein [Salinibacter ruber]